MMEAREAATKARKKAKKAARKAKAKGEAAAAADTMAGLSLGDDDDAGAAGDRWSNLTK